MTLLRASSLIACLSVATAFAQTPAPAADQPIAKPNCTKPGDFPGALGSERQRQSWQKEFLAYQDCMKKFIADQKALVDPHLRAYNAAIDDFNATVKVYNEQIEQAKGAVTKSQ